MLVDAKAAMAGTPERNRTPDEFRRTGLRRRNRQAVLGGHTPRAPRPLARGSGSRRSARALRGRRGRLGRRPLRRIGERRVGEKVEEDGPAAPPARGVLRLAPGVPGPRDPPFTQRGSRVSGREPEFGPPGLGLPRRTGAFSPPTKPPLPTRMSHAAHTPRVGRDK